MHGFCGGFFLLYEENRQREHLLHSVGKTVKEKEGKER